MIKIRPCFRSFAIALMLMAAMPALIATVSCDAESPENAIVISKKATSVMNLTSTALKDGECLNPQYTVEGQDVSPPLVWTEAPGETKSFALICDDPDAPSPKKPAPEPWVHWVLFNIPGESSELPEGVGTAREPDEVPGARQGVNSWPDNNIGYRGPAPPPGSGPHRYVFKLYALDTTLDLQAGATKPQVLKAMSGHVLAEGELVGVYERK